MRLVMADRLYKPCARKPWLTVYCAHAGGWRFSARIQVSGKRYGCLKFWYMDMTFWKFCFFFENLMVFILISKLGIWFLETVQPSSWYLLEQYFSLVGGNLHQSWPATIQKCWVFFWSVLRILQFVFFFFVQYEILMCRFGWCKYQFLEKIWQKLWAP